MEEGLRYVGEDGKCFSVQCPPCYFPQVFHTDWGEYALVKYKADPNKEEEKHHEEDEEKMKTEDKIIIANLTHDLCIVMRTVRVKLREIKKIHKTINHQYNLFLQEIKELEQLGDVGCRDNVLPSLFWEKLDELQNLGGVGCSEDARSDPV